LGGTKETLNDKPQELEPKSVINDVHKVEKSREDPFNGSWGDPGRQEAKTGRAEKRGVKSRPAPIVPQKGRFEIRRVPGNPYLGRGPADGHYKRKRIAKEVKKGATCGVSTQPEIGARRPQLVRGEFKQREGKDEKKPKLTSEERRLRISGNSGCRGYLKKKPRGAVEHLLGRGYGTARRNGRKRRLDETTQAKTQPGCKGDQV